MDSPWLEWTVCALAVALAAVSYRRGRWGFVLGLLVIVTAWLLGSAKWFYLPLALGYLALLGRRKPLGIMVVCGGALASAFLCWLFPVPKSSSLAGTFAVGSETVELPADGKSSALVAQIWYPGIADLDAPRTSWLPDPSLAPRFPFHRIRHAVSRSQAGLELAGGGKRLPVVFYEHSWTGHRAENVVQAEDLASQGFVVIAVDHPGQAARVKYRDGSVIVSRLPAALDFSTEQSVAEFEKLAEQCLLERIGNLSRIKNALTNESISRFAGKLELDGAGVFGFSFGGTCALRLCAHDPFFSAGANEDGYALGDEPPRGPFLFFDQEMPEWLLKPAGPDEGPGEALTRRSEDRILKAMAGPDRSRVIVDGARHESFSDGIYGCRVPKIVHAGTRPAAEVHQMLATRLGEFFKRELH
jgi:predicted dienelactone hydrolase